MEACVRCDLPSPFNEVTETYLHWSCEQEWWEETGPYPKPITVTVRGGGVKVISRSADTSREVWDSEDDPDHLRSRGVMT